MATVKPVPEGYPQVTPYLVVDGAGAAIDFYGKVFGATERMRLPGPDGTIGGTPVTISVYVEDVDRVIERAAQAGATVLRPVEDQFYGDRSGQFEDPFGHRWSVATHVEDVSPEEMGRRAAELVDGG